MILCYLTGFENVSLYQREFLGIDKERDEKYILTKDSFDKFHDSEESEKTLTYVEGFFFTLIGLIFFIVYILLIRWKKFDPEDETKIIMNFVFYCIYMGMLISCFICQIVFFYRIKKYNLAGYDCSDSITNELIKKGTEENAKQIIYITVNFYLNVFHVAINCIIVLVGLVLMGIDKLNWNSDEQEENKEQSEDKDNEKSDINQNSEQNNPEIPLNTYYPEQS